MKTINLSPYEYALGVLLVCGFAVSIIAVCCIIASAIGAI